MLNLRLRCLSATILLVAEALSPINDNLQMKMLVAEALSPINDNLQMKMLVAEALPLILLRLCRLYSIICK